MESVIIGGKYKHFKGNYYKVLFLARDSGSPERFFVVYQALYDSKEYGKNQVWVRELSDFIGYKKLDDGSIVKRFTLARE